MRVTTRFAWSVSIVLFGMAPLPAQGQEAPKPGPEHAKMARFVGTWNGTADMKESPFGPAGKMTWTESCEWFQGKFHVICRSEGKGPTGESKGFGVIGYDAEAKQYTWFGVDSNGWSDMAKGTLEGKTWTFGSEMKYGGKTTWSRFSIEEASATANKFKWETSMDGKSWNLVMEGESHK